MSKIEYLLSHQNGPVEKQLVVGFYDLTLYMKWASDQKASDVFTYLGTFIDMTAQSINDGDGFFVKAIGDAGLFIFSGDTVCEITHAIETMRAVQSQAGDWLGSLSMEPRVIVQMNLGIVACGQVGAPGDKRFDIYGDTVNKAALLPAQKFAITPSLYDASAVETQSKFTFNDCNSWELK